MEWMFTLNEVNAVAREFLGIMHDGSVIAFHGEMGSGKTTFVKALCYEMNVKDVVGSPTYSLINEYESNAGSIFHIDLYRLNDAEEAFRAGIEDCLYSGNTCFVEWPERAPGLFPVETVHVYLEVMNEEMRRIRF